ncbi:putative organic solvent tolerance protein, partial [Bordetella avium 197N]
VHTIRCLILSALSVAGAAQAQGSQDAAPAGRQPVGSVASPGLEMPGLRLSPGLRVRKLTEDQMPAFMEADDMSGEPSAELLLKGNAQVRRVDGVIKGDSIHYDDATSEVEVKGNARILRDATLVTGPSARINLNTYSGDIDKPNFWIGASGGTARAEHADIFSRSQMRLTDVYYSGCPCEKPSWYIKATSLDLDVDENEGVARNGVLYFKDVPILASPYLTFPIRKERKSGFLLPTYGTSSKTGLDISVPYYFNLAPNYDATLISRYMGKRGLQLGGDFRYLGYSYAGSVSGTYLPNDRDAGFDRYMYRLTHKQYLGSGFYTDWDISGVSDDNYYRDMTTLGLNTASTTYLPRQGRVGWSSNYWQTYVQVYKYRTLQDPDAPIVPPYDKEPEIFLQGARYDWNGFDVRMDSTAVRFRRPLFLGNRIGQEGERLEAYPTIAYPIVRAGWYFTPKAGLNYTQYHTSWFNQDWNRLGSLAPYRGTESRTLPIVSLDTGMTFERPTTLFGKDSTQTLEPRLYYLRVPYRNQSALPVYDTSLADFSFEQAFQENIYTGGWDRIANANQLTVGLTTRWLDASTGFQRVALSAAQRLYFEDQRVTLPGETPRENVRSDFLVGASAALTDTLTTDLAAQYNPYDNNWSRGLVSARWTPQRQTTLALAYRYQRDPISNISYAPRGQNQVTLAFQWPFTQRWYGVGRVDYAIRSDTGGVVGASDSARVTQAIAGLEYKGDCCWTGRVVFQRYAVAANDANTAVFFQLELTGLGALGTDPLKLLDKSIPGYQPVSQPTPAGTTFERYE